MGAGSLSFQACVGSLLGAASLNPNSFKTECGHWQVLKPSFPWEPRLTTDRTCINRSSPSLPSGNPPWKCKLRWKSYLPNKRQNRRNLIALRLSLSGAQAVRPQAVCGAARPAHCRTRASPGATALVHPGSHPVNPCPWLLLPRDHVFIVVIQLPLSCCILNKWQLMAYVASGTF